MNLLKYLDTEADKLHEENFSSSDEFRTVNHSFVEGFNYALAIVQGYDFELNDNQQVVLEWLKQLSLFPISALHLLEAGRNVPEQVKKAYEDFDKQEERQLLIAFADLGEEQ